MIEKQLKNAVDASRKLSQVPDEFKKKVLIRLANAARLKSEMILSENQKDLERMNPDDPKFDRLTLTHDRIESIAADIENVANLESPLHKILSKTTHPNGLNISKITVPFGVIGIIYESRPNVTFDVFSLCFKAGNACVLKGGSDAIFSNLAIISVIQDVLKESELDINTVNLLPAGHDETNEMLNARGFIDLIIPRGSQSLIDFVRENSKIPVIETGAGICHTYLDESGDSIKATEIVFNAKTRRPAVCNALDCLIIHRSRLKDLIGIAEKLKEKRVVIFADGPSFQILNETYPGDLLFPVTEESYGTEFLSLKMSVKTVENFGEAIAHINKYSSKHSEAIISENPQNISQFLKIVDAAAVFSNASTAFTDGAQFGLGAEIGISTQKLHARGPMAINELTSYKWIIEGNGQTRPV